MCIRDRDNTHPAALEYYLDFINRDIQQITYRMRVTQANKLQKLMKDQLQTFDNIKHKQTFYTRLRNLTSIELNSDKTELLNKGLKYNLPLHTSNSVSYTHLDVYKRQVIDQSAAVYPYKLKTCHRHIFHKI